MAKHSVGATLLDRSVAREPSWLAYRVDGWFRAVAYLCGVAAILLLAYILLEIGAEAAPGMGRSGIGFLASSIWAPSQGQFGILAEIWGTFYSSMLALLIAGAFGVAIAIFLTQDFLPPAVAYAFRTAIELLAAIPSVVYGLWGIFVVIPAIRPAATWLHNSFSFIPLFGTEFAGPSMAPAVIVLAIMVLPTVASISQGAFTLIPYKVKEAAYGMGATRWEAIVKVMIPTAATGISAALVLGFGRALGETMALTMIIGNANQVSVSLFAPGRTLASLIASQFPEAGQVEREALMYSAFVLLAFTLVVNIAGTIIMSLSAKQKVT